jgi:hypothetical protein
MLPELEDIHDTDLRDKIIAVWEDALTMGQWQIDDLKRMPFTLLVQGVEITFIEHVRTVCQMCIAMEKTLTDAYGDRIKIHHDYLVAGALIADVGKLLEFSEKGGSFEKGELGKYLRHPFTGVGLCYRHDVPYQVAHLSAVHSKEGEGGFRSAEAIIFHHADFTDFELVGG